MNLTLSLILAAGTIVAPTGSFAGDAQSANRKAAPDAATSGAVIPSAAREAPAPADTDSDIIMKMIDLRDLSAVMSTASRARPIAAPESEAASGSESSPFRDVPKFSSPADPVLDLADRLCDALGAQITVYSKGIMVVSGEAAAITRLEQLLEEAWSVHSDRYDIDLVIAVFPSDQVPALGSVLSGGSTLARQRRGVVSRTPTDISMTETMRYVGGWTPIVSDNAVGYQPIVSSIAHGLDGDITVSPNGAPAGGPATFTITLTGTLSRAAINPRTIEVSAPGGSSTLPLDNFVVRSRSIGTRGLAGHEPTVLAALPGFEDGQTIVLAAGVLRARAGR
ncbi:MAG: hypothetical protein KF787_01720 [Phycisphaeraceae bacterium]|nr:hypothetical protein [Phycisphaerae bacterium]MBX3391341.1 hypothetical protein [Phycisphaeraceae bacterium]HRJ50286.1 hypothetical protein [Phycisphaerales bacterium]